MRMHYGAGGKLAVMHAESQVVAACDQFVGASFPTLRAHSRRFAREFHQMRAQATFGMVFGNQDAIALVRWALGRSVVDAQTELVTFQIGDR